MKKILSVVLAAMIMLASVMCTAAENDASKVNFSIESKGKNTLVVPAGTEITVDVRLDTSDEYSVITLTDEIDFNEDFFEYVGNITSHTDGVSGVRQSYSSGLNIIKVMASYSSPVTYEASKKILSFKLKVKDTAENFGVVRSDADRISICGFTNYDTTNADLTVIIGDEEKEYSILSFETNGGSEVDAVAKENGTTVDLSGYTPTKSGYTFDGWYSDSALTTKVTSVTLDADKTVYAKWKGNSSGGTGGGGGGGSVATKYTVSFETNGGSEVKSMSVNASSIIDLSEVVTARDGYTFDGWYTDDELSQKVESIKVTSNVTLYAKWIEGGSAGASAGIGHRPDILTDEHFAYIQGRDGGYIHPEDNLTRAEAATIFYRLLTDEVRENAETTENDFEDCSTDDWYNTAVSTLANMGIINGKSPVSFAPNDNITRAELTAIVARLSDATYTGEDLFDDIYGHWANDYINTAASIEWIKGDGGLFRPDDNITRAEVVTLVNRVLGRQPESKDDLIDGMIVPPDNTNEDAWYYLAVQEAVNGHDYELKADSVHEKWISLTEKGDL